MNPIIYVYQFTLMLPILYYSDSDQHHDSLDSIFQTWHVHTMSLSDIKSILLATFTKCTPIYAIFVAICHHQEQHSMVLAQMHLPHRVPMDRFLSHLNLSRDLPPCHCFTRKVYYGLSLQAWSSFVTRPCTRGGLGTQVLPLFNSNLNTVDLYL